MTISSNNKMTISSKINRQAEIIHETSLKLGLVKEEEKTGINCGSKRDGVPYRIYLLKPESIGHFNHPAFNISCGLIGATKKEALATLETIVQVLRSVLFSKGI